MIPAIYTLTGFAFLCGYIQGLIVLLPPPYFLKLLVHYALVKPPFLGLIRVPELDRHPEQVFPVLDSLHSPSTWAEWKPSRAWRFAREYGLFGASMTIELIIKPVGA